MVSGMEIAEPYAEAPRYIYQRRAYAARRALIAIDHYSALVFTLKSAAQKERAFRWMTVWMTQAVDRQC